MAKNRLLIKIIITFLDIISNLVRRARFLKNKAKSELKKEGKERIL